jgi:hypothetical protein
MRAFTKSQQPKKSVRKIGPLKKNEKRSHSSSIAFKRLERQKKFLRILQWLGEENEEQCAFRDTQQS